MPGKKRRGSQIENDECEKAGTGVIHGNPRLRAGMAPMGDSSMVMIMRDLIHKGCGRWRWIVTAGCWV